MSMDIPVPCTLAEQLCRKALEISYNPRTEPIVLQLIRAANSVSANILEGLGTGYEKNSLRYYRIARGSALECTTHARCLLTLESECWDVYDAVCHFISQEAWLFENKEALSAVKQGLKQSAEGKTKSRGSFSK